MNRDDMPLEVIRFLRFPLSVAILVIHAHFSEIAAGGRQIFDAADFPCLRFGFIHPVRGLSRALPFRCFSQSRAICFSAMRLVPI